MICWLQSLFHRARWQYGTCTTSHPAARGNEAYTQTRPARRNRASGEVQFVLWPRGHQTTHADGTVYTYTEDFWHRYDPSWWGGFTAGALPIAPLRSGDRCKCGHCGFEGVCYGVAHSHGVSAPCCHACGMNDRLATLP